MTSMKKTDKFLSAAVLTAAVLCTSCSTDDLAAQQQGQGETKAVSLTATLGEAQTRAGMSKGTYDNTASFYWHNKDSILVQTVKASDNTYPGARFVTTEETGATVAVFWGEPLSGVTLGNYAVYPYNKKHAFTSETALTYNLPATYTYTTVDNGIFSKTSDDVTTYRTNSTNIPMYGKITDGNVQFDYLGGLAVIRIDKMPYTSGTLTVTADQQLSGDFTVDLSADNPEMTTASTETKDNKQVTFTFSGAKVGDVGVFYLPLATGEYTNLSIKISDSDDANTQTIPYGALSVTRGNVQAISLTTYNSYLRNIRQLTNGSYIVNGHEFVDLGLVSGLLWATMNVGATSATDNGTYFAWGEVTMNKTTWSWDNYAYGTADNLTKYKDSGLTTLEAEDDAATVNWGNSCRMPTATEFEELCNATWTAVNDSEKNSFKGWTITANNSSSIFLPAAGYRDGVAYQYTGGNGYYWTSTLNTTIPSQVRNLYFHSNGHTCDGSHSRYCGLTVRPVTTK